MMDNLEFGVSGFFEAAVLDKNGAEVRKYPIQKNAILNQALQFMHNMYPDATGGVNTIANGYDVCYRGIGTLLPVSVTDTHLETLATGNVSSLLHNSYSNFEAPDGSYGDLIQLFIFPLNTVDETYTEVGLGRNGLYSGNGLFTRSKFVTPIEVLAEESLKITYTLRIMSPPAVPDITIVHNGVTHTGTTVLTQVPQFRQSTFSTTLNTNYKYTHWYNGAWGPYVNTGGNFPKKYSGMSRSGDLSTYECNPAVDGYMQWNIYNSVTSTSANISASISHTYDNDYQVNSHLRIGLSTTFTPVLPLTDEEIFKLSYRVSFARA